MDGYRRVLERYAEDATAWKALPGEVAAWWRRRRASTPAPGTEGWTVVGPGAGEAEVEFTWPR
jgi:hypothetical protein